MKNGELLFKAMA